MSTVPTAAVDGVPDPLPDELSVLDVREPFEWEHGHIEGAIHIPLMDLPERLDEVSGGQTLVVCKVGQPLGPRRGVPPRTGLRRRQPRRRHARLVGRRSRHGERDRRATTGRLADAHCVGNTVRNSDGIIVRYSLGISVRNSVGKSEGR